MTRYLNKDTTVCISLAARPSNFGTRFHNFLYDALDLDYLYKAFTTNDLAAAIGGVRALGFRGCAISMPFKEAVIPMVDEMDPSAKAINSVNTLVNTGGYLKAYNTDYIAIAKLLQEYQVPVDNVFALRGSGGMAKAVAFALKNAGFKQGYIIATNEKTGKQLAEQSGYIYRPDMQNIQADMLINATPVGMAGGLMLINWPLLKLKWIARKLFLMLWRCPPSPRLSAMLRLRENSDHRCRGFCYSGCRAICVIHRYPPKSGAV